MNIDLEGDEEINPIKDARARSNACYKWRSWDISRGIANMMEINPLTINKHKGDSHLLTPMILWWGKWMTNLVATTPIYSEGHEKPLH